MSKQPNVKVPKPAEVSPEYRAAQEKVAELQARIVDINRRLEDHVEAWYSLQTPHPVAEKVAAILRDPAIRCDTLETVVTGESYTKLINERALVQQALEIARRQLEATLGPATARVLDGGLRDEHRRRVEACVEAGKALLEAGELELAVRMALRDSGYFPSWLPPAGVRWGALWSLFSEAKDAGVLAPPAAEALCNRCDLAGQERIQWGR